MSTYGAPTRTADDVLKSVQRRFGDESGVQLEDTDIWGWINEAQTVIVTKNRILKVKVTTPLIAGTSSYSFATLPRPIYAIDSLYIGGARIRNLSMSHAEESILAVDPTGVQEGYPEFWYEYAGEVIFWPKPSTGDTITLRYTARPTPVTSSSSPLSVPDDYFPEVVNYVLQQAYEMDENQPMMQAKGQQFEQSLAERGEYERTAQNMTYESITVLDDGW
jgi:hypothetical protein